MFFQISLGTVLMMLSIIVSAVAFWILETLLIRARPWLARPPHRPKLMAVLCLSVLWSFSTVTAGVWIWASAFYMLDVFVTLEGSVYFSLVAFTTLGFGDILLPHQWRLLGGLAAANGLLNFGLLTAMLVEVMRYVRVEQIEAEAEKMEQKRRAGVFFGGRR